MSTTEDDDDAKVPQPVRPAHAALANAWGRHGRADIQSSHTLSSPLARLTPEHVEAGEHAFEGHAESSPAFAIPAGVAVARAPQKLPEDAFCRSPIAGLVIAVRVAAGQEVTRHQPVIVIEAMKMQNDISAEVDGVVKTMHVAPGDAVKAGQVLFELA